MRACIDSGVSPELSAVRDAILSGLPGRKTKSRSRRLGTVQKYFLQIVVVFRALQGLEKIFAFHFRFFLCS